MFGEDDDSGPALWARTRRVPGNAGWDYQLRRALSKVYAAGSDAVAALPRDPKRTR